MTGKHLPGVFQTGWKQFKHPNTAKHLDDCNTNCLWKRERFTHPGKKLYSCRQPAQKLCKEHFMRCMWAAHCNIWSACDHRIQRLIICQMQTARQLRHTRGRWPCTVALVGRNTTEDASLLKQYVAEQLQRQSPSKRVFSTLKHHGKSQKQLAEFADISQRPSRSSLNATHKINMINTA